MGVAYLITFTELIHDSVICLTYELALTTRHGQIIHRHAENHFVIINTAIVCMFKMTHLYYIVHTV